VSKTDEALALAARGFKVFPLKAGTKAPPLVSGWPRAASADADEVRRLFAACPPDSNIGIHCAGMIVVDVDVKKGGNASLELLELLDGELPPTLTTRTPTGGCHLFYRLPPGHPGVPNGVDCLGAGLDIRSAGGYVVAPESEVPTGHYRFEVDCPIADAPDWLVQKFGAFTEREHNLGANTQVPDAPEVVIERAWQWLERQEPAVEGAGGDHRTFAVACGLRDRGVSEEQALNLLRDHWNDRCSPPWSLADLETKVRNAYRYAQDAPGSKAALPDEFPLIGPAPVATRPSQVVSLDDFVSRPRNTAGYLVKGLLNRASYAEIYGPPGQGKTFLALDLGFHVAVGLEWAGHRVKQAPVLYVGFEAFGGLANRAKALRAHYGAPGVPLYFAPGHFNLCEPEGRRALGALIAEMPAKPGFIIFDTFAYALMGGDENSAQDVGAFNQGVQALITATGACVLIIHHTGKDEKKGARGSSALRAALDTEIAVNEGILSGTKQRELEIGAPVAFKLMPLVVGEDEDGEAETSCYVETHTVISSNSPRVKLKEGTPARMAWEVLCAMRPQNDSVTDQQWRRACEFLPPGKPGDATFRKAKHVLRHGKLIVVDESDLITRRLE